MKTQLAPTEVRVLGTLIEKEMTTPLTYPLSLNSLINACNQKTNRHPVVHYDAKTVLHTVESLREKFLVETVFPGSSRTAKYKHDFAYQYGLNAKSQALLGMLMLRGPQTAGQLRSRTTRMTRFDDIQAVTAALEELIIREEGPLVALLPRVPGQKERRYAHLLAGEPEIPDLDTPPNGDSHQPDVDPAITEERIAALEGEVAQLRRDFDALRRDLARGDASP